MNAIHCLRGLMVAISLFFFSCENEPVDPQPASPITGLICSVPSNVTAVRSTDTSMATMLWDANVDQNSWQIQYGNMGFVLGSGATVYSNAPSKIFTGLSETMGYDFYIRSVCSETEFSEWVGPITVGPVGVIITANYWPLAAQNQWVFSIENINQPPWKITGTEVINAETYYTFQQISGEPLRRVRKSAVGDYFDRYEEYTDADTTISGNETIILKDYLPVNSTWTNSYVETTTTTGMTPEVVNVEIVSKIIERDAMLTVPAGTFNEVIAVQRVKTITAAGIPDETITTTYWFAKNRGPIQVQTEENGVITVKKLTAYILY